MVFGTKHVCVVTVYAVNMKGLKKYMGSLTYLILLLHEARFGSKVELAETLIS